MEYRWSHDTVVLEPVFDSRPEAEEWLSENWRDLADAGVDEVTLLCDGEVVYGPMSLHA